VPVNRLPNHFASRHQTPWTAGQQPPQTDVVQRGIGIAGVVGRMGRLLAEQADQAGLTVAGGFDRPGAQPPGIPWFTDLADLAGACDVVVDFTHASVAARHADILGRAGVPWVVGTSGLTDDDQRSVVAAARLIPVVQAANFSPAVSLMLALAQRMAAALPADRYDAEILEMHHRQKVDAPSGTALALGRAVAAGRGVALDSLRESGRDGQTGARRPGAIGFAALRGGQVVGEHTLLFAGDDEQISLTHRAFDRRSFAAGAIRAAAWVIGRPPGLYGMIDVLGVSTG
jgi:4-hydroxy-tetrahydrodipicolinate reductase